jgi:hypothetical protein
MSYPFIFPCIVHLPAGYDCTIPLPYESVADRLIGGNGTVIYGVQVFCAGRMRAEWSEKLIFANGCLVGPPPDPFTWRDAGEDWGGNSGYLEVSLQAADARPMFHARAPISFYSIYTKPGKKAFFSDNAYKYGAPPVIAQIAAFGKFVEGYPVVHIDRERDLGQTLALINPYKKVVSARVHTCDGRTLGPLKVPPASVRLVRLVELLRPREASWLGQVQLTANNRVVTYVMMHSLRSPCVLSDHEHLDVFRSDPTHIPAFQLLRRRIGKILRSQGLVIR